jgi:peroxiredoxin/outer membrane lipoprotein-sorting protein
MKQIRVTAYWSVVLSAVAICSQASADATTQPSAHASVDSVLSAMDSAYSALKSAQFNGHIVGRFDAAGQIKNEDVAFTSSFAAPNQFRHEIKSEILLGSTGKNVYSYLSSREAYQNADAPKGRASSSDWPASVVRILQDQNPSLLLAISKSAADELKQLSSKISLLQPTTVDGVAYDTLRFDDNGDGQTITMLIDPSTHLLHEVKTDLRKSFTDAGTADVKAAEVNVQYSNSAPDAPILGDAFAWTAPAGAMLVSATSAAPGDDGMSDDVKALIGKAAPDFTLKGLDDKPLKLSDTRGSVVILDFWATWCGPCVASLPHLDKLYKDQSPNGLKAFAVDLQEDKSRVAGFVQKQGWTLPVLLDTDAVAAGLYKAESIPQTVVIGKDGKIKQIFVGGNHEEEIASLVLNEMK